MQQTYVGTIETSFITKPLLLIMDDREDQTVAANRQKDECKADPGAEGYLKCQRKCRLKRKCEDCGLNWVSVSGKARCICRNCVVAIDNANDNTRLDRGNKGNRNNADGLQAARSKATKKPNSRVHEFFELEAECTDDSSEEDDEASKNESVDSFIAPEGSVSTHGSSMNYASNVSIDDDTSEDSEDGCSDAQLPEEVNWQCQLCHRWASEDEIASFDGSTSVDCYLSLTMQMHHVNSVKMSRKWKWLMNEDIFNGDCVCLCVQCSNCQSNVGIKERQSCEWAPFMWALLQHEDVQEHHATKLWQVLPCLWRKWWIKSVKQFPCYSEVTVSDPESQVNEVTKDVREVSNALRELKLVTLAQTCDKLLSVPTVKCPWGCSEFLNLARNYMPLDALLLDYLEKPAGVSKISTKSNDGWLQGVLPAFLESKHFVINSTYGYCSPSIAFHKEFGPCFLACRHHSTKTRGQYIHPPPSPFRHLSSKLSDQHSSAIPKPRTIGSVKRKAYSHCFHTVQMKGAYEGIDTMVLGNEGNYSMEDCISKQYDNLAIACRSDIAEHLHHLGADGVISPALAAAKAAAARDMFPSMKAKAVKQNGRKHATYVPAEIALLLESRMKGSPETEVERHVPDSDDVDVVQFRPMWPSSIAIMHPCNKHGKEPCCIQPPKTQSKLLRSLWLFTSMAVSVPSLWHEIVAMVDDNVSWHGWFLSLAMNTCCKSMKLRCDKQDPFRNPKSSEAVAKLMFQSSKATCAEDAAEVIATLPNVSVVQLSSVMNLAIAPLADQILSQDVDLGSTEVLVIVRDRHCTATLDEDVFIANNSSWECRLKTLARRNGVAFQVRHGGNHLGWWKQDTCGRAQVMRKIRDTSQVQGQLWALYVYVKVNDPGRANDRMKKQCLKMLGGQSYMLCAIHRQNLVTSSSRQLGEPKLCFKCGATKLQLECPMMSCSVGVCKEHVLMQQTGVEDHYETPFWHGSTGDDSTQQSRSNNVEATTIDTSQLLEQPLNGEDRIAEMEDADIEALSTIDTDMNNDNHSLSEPNDNESLWEPCFHEEDYPFIDEEMSLTVDDGSNGNEGLDQADAVIANDESCLEFCETSGVAQPSDTQFNSTGDCIGSHVILNKHARLLVRRHGKLLTTRQQRAFMERIVATGKRSVPLLYTEASIFSSMFWDSYEDGSMIGAMPTAMLCRSETLGQVNVAPLHHQLRTRIANAQLGCSGDFRYQFFGLDVATNLGAQHHDTRLILSRGFGEQMGASGIRMIPDEETVFYDTEQVENRPIVNKIAAAIGERMATFFYTHTCSMKNHIVMRKLKAAVDDERTLEEAATIVGADLSLMTEEECNELHNNVIGSCASILIRAWDNIFDIWMHYICNSPEKPAGSVDWCVHRKELQDKTANLYHGHSILWCTEDDGTDAGRDFLVQKIRASMDTIVTYNEAQKLLEQGALSSMEQLWDILRELKTNLSHKHDRRCQVPVSRRNDLSSSDGDVQSTRALNEYRCKVADNRTLSRDPANHTFMCIDLTHLPLAEEIMTSLGFFVRTDTCSAEQVYDRPYQRFVYYDKDLQPKRHVPPSSAEDGVQSPVFARITILNPNSDNVQFLDSYGVSKYLAKYLAEVDEAARVYVQAPKYNDQSPTMTFHTEETKNTKITSVAMATEQARKTSKKKHVGRAMTQTECLMLLFNMAPITTNIKFVHLSTVPLEERPAVDRKLPLLSLKRMKVIDNDVNAVADLDENKVIPAIMVRQHLGRRFHSRLPTWRQHSPSDIAIAKDQILSPYSLDTVTVFGLRPPELSFVYSQTLYHKWFSRESLKFTTEELKDCNYFEATLSRCEENFSVYYDRCAWIDSNNKQIKLRVQALPAFIEYVRSCSIERFGRSINEKNTVLNFAIMLLQKMQEEQNGTLQFRTEEQRAKWLAMRSTFLCEHDAKHLPVHWYTPIKPTNTSRFLFHVLLSMGEFRNEMDLLTSGSLRDAFVHAQLFDPQNPQESVRVLMRRYVKEQLQHMPGGTRQFDRQLIAANIGLEGLLLSNTIVTPETPPYLYTHLREAVSTEVSERLESLQMDYLSVLIKDALCAGVSNLPSVDDLQNARHSRIAPWELRSIGIGRDQPQESFDEQQYAREAIEETVDLYCSGSDTCPKCPILVGDPGSGKTTMMQFALLHCASRGLNTFATALMSERANQLGVVHLNELISLPVLPTTNASRLAEAAMARLYHQPWKMALIKTIDVLGFDEYGALPAHFISVMDIVFRRMRKSTRFMGGVLLIPSMDAKQLHPIQGMHPLLSSHVITCFTFLRLRHSVRAASDPTYRRIQKITRLPKADLTEEVKKEFVELVCGPNGFTFISSFDDPAIPRTAIRVFGKKEPGLKLQRKLIQDLKQHQEHRLSKASDEQSTNESVWQSASAYVTRRLNNETKEASELLLCKDIIYQITFNKPGAFSQSQFAVIVDLPSEDTIQRKKPFEMYVAPPGWKTIPPRGATKSDLVDMGWRPRLVGKAPARSRHVSARLNGRRHQYGLRMFTTSTIHAIMGQTCDAIVTKVSTNDPEYDLWQREQVIVLLSRTRAAKDVFVCGDPQATATALFDILLKTSEFSDYIADLLESLAFRTQREALDMNSTPTIPQINFTHHPYRPIDRVLPTDNGSYAYILVSKSHPELTYIGETDNLVRRLSEHYAGRGCKQTSDPRFRPWGLLAFVVGLTTKNDRKAFEHEWEHLRQTAPSTLNAMEISKLALVVIAQRMQRNPASQLTFVPAGEITFS